MSSGQLLVSKIHSKFNSRNKITGKNAKVLVIHTWEKIAPPYTSPYLTPNLLSDHCRPLYFISYSNNKLAPWSAPKERGKGWGMISPWN